MKNQATYPPLPAFEAEHYPARQNPNHTAVALFNLGASIYDLLTTQDYWKNSACRLARHFQSTPGDMRILDLGCGAGVSAFALAESFDQAQIVGVDIADKMIEKARYHHRADFPHLPHVQFEVADAARLPFADGSFDIAIGHSFLYLVPQKLKVLREVNRILKKDGQIVLMEPYAAGSLLRTVVERTDYFSKIWQKPGPTLRFISSIVAWRIFSCFQGQFSSECIRRIFAQAGFCHISIAPTLNQLGIYCLGNKP